MKWVSFILLVMFIGRGTVATAQRRILNINQLERLRLRDLNLTDDQKRRLALLVQRERLQFYMNQKELDAILTEKQKAMLLAWRSKRMNNPQDSTKKLTGQ
jgi:alpha-galactosidase/6-phospho-beta-glucosidase family protein